MVNHMRERICPNPKCQRKIEEPILLNNLSTTPAKQYYACPHCFIKLKANSTSAILAGLLLTAFGSIVLVWVGWLIWYDMTRWGKNIVLILLESRTSEAYSLGIDVRVIHYFLIGLAFLLSGLLTFFRGRRSKVIGPDLSATAPEKARTQSKCPYNFGYLKKLNQDTHIPDECLGCSRMLECSSSNTGAKSPTRAKLK